MDSRKSYYQKHRDTLIQKQLDYYYENRESILAKQREYRESKRDDIVTYQEIYRQINRPHLRRKAKVRYIINKKMKKISGYQRITHHN